MKQDILPVQPQDCSCLQLEVWLEKSWIDHFLSQQQVVIPVTEKYNLIQLRLELEEGRIALEADIREKEGTTIRMTCEPKWDPALQQMALEQFEIHAKSKNLVVKSASWFAQTFLKAQIDRKIEEAADELYARQLDSILQNGIHIPMPGTGSIEVQVRSVMINELIFLTDGIKVKAMIDGHWKLQLSIDEERKENPALR